jgi:GT2 family glycosyltransferase
MTPAAAFVIPTRFRTVELCTLLRSILVQTVPVEIHVMNDGDNDGAAQMIQSEFPQVHYHRIAAERGPAFQRNRGIEICSTNIVFPVDDDTLFVSPWTVEQTIAEFDHPRVAAVGIPYINVRQNPMVRQRAPAAGGIYVAHAFVGAAHAIRRDVFLKYRGYREHFFYMGEEGDLCLRMLQAGYVTRLGSADPIHHLESPNRVLARASFCGRRNDILFAWHNVPLPYLPLHLLATTLNGLCCAAVSKHPLRMIHGTMAGYLACLRHWRGRIPVECGIYKLYRWLKRREPRRLEEIERCLPPLDMAGDDLTLLAGGARTPAT